MVDVDVMFDLSSGVGECEAEGEWFSVGLLYSKIVSLNMQKQVTQRSYHGKGECLGYHALLAEMGQHASSQITFVLFVKFIIFITSVLIWPVLVMPSSVAATATLYDDDVMNPDVLVPSPKTAHVTHSQLIWCA